MDDLDKLILETRKQVEKNPEQIQTTLLLSIFECLNLIYTKQSDLEKRFDMMRIWGKSGL